MKHKKVHNLTNLLGIIFWTNQSTKIRELTGVKKNAAFVEESMIGIYVTNIVVVVVMENTLYSRH